MPFIFQHAKIRSHVFGKYEGGSHFSTKFIERYERFRTNCMRTSESFMCVPTSSCFGMKKKFHFYKNFYKRAVYQPKTWYKKIKYTIKKLLGYKFKPKYIWLSTKVSTLQQSIIFNNSSVVEIEPIRNILKTESIDFMYSQHNHIMPSLELDQLMVEFWRSRKVFDKKFK